MVIPKSGGWWKVALIPPQEKTPLRPLQVRPEGHGGTRGATAIYLRASEMCAEISPAPDPTPTLPC
jgi:hypothetical protein